MDFFEKIGEIAKNVSEKAGDSMELNRLGGEISIAKGNIQCYKQELAEHVWAKFVLGEVEDSEANMICDKIVASMDHIKELEQEIEQVHINRQLAKEEDQAAKLAEKAEKEAAKKAAEEEAARKAAEATQEIVILGKTAEEIPEEVMETEEVLGLVQTSEEIMEVPEEVLDEVVMPEVSVCKACGASVAEGQKFCGSCGKAV